MCKLIIDYERIKRVLIVGLHFIAAALQHMLNLNAPVKSLAVAEPVWKVSLVHHVARSDILLVFKQIDSLLIIF